MEITEVKLTLKNEGKLRGYANITIDDSFVVRGLKIIDGNNGLFVSMPSRRRPNGSFQDIAHPININTRKMIENRVLDAYKEKIENLNK